MEGQINLRDAVRRNISFRDPKSGKTYQLKQQVRPGFHYDMPFSHRLIILTCQSLTLCSGGVALYS